MTADEVRQSFLDFFRSKGHAIVPSASLMPSAPNLLFTNAGMNQFVPFFLGEREPSEVRLADTQKCIRAGGKHNDLDDVGYDAYHHTFFEMLGNWSIGDYFKPEAIEWAWKLLTGVWGFPKERLYATVYKPGPGEPADFDQEAATCWRAIFEREGLDPQVHIVNGGMKDNFWMMGDTGPCGPCSEVHMDLTEAGDTQGRLVNADSPRCIEIWNLVFIQFNARADGSYSPLKSRHVDTGMGFERVAGILATTQNFTDYTRPPSNYESDLFTGIFAAIESLSGHPYQGTLPEDPSRLSETEARDTAYRVLADHIRTLCCAIADGILPGNDGRNYVLRRILRRAVMWSQRIGLPQGSFAGLAPAVIAKLGGTFPELQENATTIRRVLENEESAFERTIGRGLLILDKLTDEAGEGGIIAGKDAFALYDTYGFPVDLTAIIARERGLRVDQEGFEAEMDRQRQQARSARKTTVVEVSEGRQGANPTAFIGYDPETLSGEPARLVDRIDQADACFLVFDRTPFYAEMGGQTGDRGAAVAGGTRIQIVDTVLDPAGRALHRVAEEDRAAAQGLETGSTALLHVDVERRREIQRHHSATHILHWALREVLGKHVHQAGSLVAPDRLRFDFSHFEQPSTEEIDRIERLANERILEALPVRWYEVPFDERPTEAMAFFGEKYGEVVRVVDIGGFSVELCGGTHVGNAGEIGLLQITGESGIAAGTRRIEAVAGKSAYQRIHDYSRAIESLAQRLSSKPDELGERIDSLLNQRAELDKEIKRYRQQEAARQADQLASGASARDGLKFVASKVAADSPNDLRGLAIQIIREIGEGVAVLGGDPGGKATLVALASPEAVKAGYRAGEIVGRLCSELGGRGGGKPDFAMGGAKESERIAEVLDAWLREQTS